MPTGGRFNLRDGCVQGVGMEMPGRRCVEARRFDDRARRPFWKDADRRQMAYAAVLVKRDGAG